MSDNGYVYVLMNPSMIDMVKIGKTVREPETRAKELSSTTGVPTPFIVVYHAYFESCTNAEIFIHTYLENKGYRVSKDREFFEIGIKDAIDAVITARQHFGEFKPDGQSYVEDKNSKPDLKPWEEVFKQAEAYYYGYGDELQDYDDAMEYYLKAIKLGSIEAYRNVGVMYRKGEGVRENEKKARQFFKKGIKKGDINCHAELALLYRYDFENALKSWNNYFNLEKNINPLFANFYVKCSLVNAAVNGSDMRIMYIEKIKAEKDKILSIWLDEINKYPDSSKELNDLIKYFEFNFILDEAEKSKNIQLINTTIQHIETIINDCNLFGLCYQ